MASKVLGKINYPKAYHQIMTGKEFKAAFTAIDRNWTQLVTDYFN